MGWGAWTGLALLSVLTKTDTVLGLHSFVFFWDDRLDGLAHGATSSSRLAMTGIMCLDLERSRVHIVKLCFLGTQ